VTDPEEERLLPSASDLRFFEQSLPGAGDYLLRMAAAAQAHSQLMDREAAALAKRGQLFGLIVALSFLGVSGILVGIGHGLAGTVMGSVDLVALTTVFVVGKRNQTAERQADSSSAERLLERLRRAPIVEPESVASHTGERQHGVENPEAGKEPAENDRRLMDPVVPPLEISTQDQELWKKIMEQEGHS
jgi:uncharacterized membrane protein